MTKSYHFTLTSPDHSCFLDQNKSIPIDKNMKRSYLLIEFIILGGQIREPSIFKLFKKPQFLFRNNNDYR